MYYQLRRLFIVCLLFVWVQSMIVLCDKVSHLQWLAVVGGTSQDYIHAVSKTSNDSTIYIAGRYAGSNSVSAIFGTYTLSGFATGAAFDDIFVAKLDTNGTVLWAVRAGGIAAEQATGVAPTLDGGVFVTGFINVGSAAAAVFESTTTTFSESLYGFATSPQTSRDMFIAKYDYSGAFQWAKTAGGEGADTGNGIASTTDGGVVVIGQVQFTSYGGVVNFGGTTITNPFVSMSTDAYLAKYKSNGDFEWVIFCGTPGDDNGRAVVVDKEGGIFITGSYSASTSTKMKFTSVTSTTKEITGYNKDGATLDFFLAKYDASGNLVWVTSGGGSSTDAGYSLDITSDGGIIVTGSIYGSSSKPVMFGPVQVQGLTKEGGYLFIAKFDANGKLEWISLAANFVSNPNYVYGVVATKDGGALMSGAVCGTDTIKSTFGSIQVAGLNAYAGNSDGFIAKYDSMGNAAWVRILGGNDADTAYAVTVSNDTDSYYVVGTVKGSKTTTYKFEKDVTGYGSVSATYDGYIAKFTLPYYEYCFGIDAKSQNVCSGSGKCVSRNNCVCDSGWAGYNCDKACEYCQVNYNSR
jgi:hypothetical protein